MVISSRFQSTADCPDPGVKVTGDRGPGPDRAVAASVGTATPATTAAMAMRTRAFPVLRMRGTPLDWGRLAATAGSRPRPCWPGLSTITCSTWWVFTVRGGRPEPLPGQPPGTGPEHRPNAPPRARAAGRAADRA